MKKLWMGLLAGMLCLSACTANPAPNEDENNAAKPAELLISAAASMTDCLTELAELYKAAAQMCIRDRDETGACGFCL